MEKEMLFQYVQSNTHEFRLYTSNRKYRVSLY